MSDCWRRGNCWTRQKYEDLGEIPLRNEVTSQYLGGLGKGRREWSPHPVPEKQRVRVGRRKNNSQCLWIRISLRDYRSGVQFPEGWPFKREEISGRGTRRENGRLISASLIIFSGLTCKRCNADPTQTTT
jgi:hypothetical protein